MWELDSKESWVMKNWCFWIVVLEKTLDSPLVNKEIQPVHPKGNQAWIFIGRTDAEAETPILWPPDAKNWPIGKDPDSGKHWKWEKRTTKAETVVWHHWLNGHEFEQTLGVRDGQGSLSAVVHGITKSHTWRTTELNWGLYVHVQNSYRGMQKVRADTSTKAQMFHFIERLSYLCLWDFIKISQHSLEKKKFIGGLFQLSYKKCLKMNKLKSGYLLVCQQQGGLGDFSCSSAPKNPRERRGSSYWKRKC